MRRDALPLNAAGKVDKPLLRRAYGAPAYAPPPAYEQPPPPPAYQQPPPAYEQPPPPPAYEEPLPDNPFVPKS